MGDTCIIARRLKSGQIQYGCCGKGGYYTNVGQMLAEWYQEPDTVEYLFRLGQLKSLGVPGSEKGGYSIFYTHELTGTPHLLCDSEQDILNALPDIHYIYFYDSNNRWYYIYPDTFRIKVPLSLVGSNLDAQGYEFAFHTALKKKLVSFLLKEYPNCDAHFRRLLTDSGYDREELLQIILKSGDPLQKFCAYPKISDYFDRWILILPDPDNKTAEKFLVHAAGETHIETDKWNV